MLDYIVRVGDTVAKVALRHQIRPLDLVLQNAGLVDVNSYLIPGQRLVIPQKNQVKERDSRFQCVAEYGQMDVETEMKYLINDYSSFIQASVIGQSVMGKPLHCLKIGEGKKEVFYSAGWHANEWLTTKLLMTFVSELLEHWSKGEKWHGYDLEQIFSATTLYVVPLVNPDGVELVQQGIYPSHPFYNEVLQINKGSLRFEHWSSNIRGVDLNHQWPAGWEKEAKESPKQPWPRHYSGRAPLTEPEAIAIHSLTKARDFAYVLAFHSQGQVIYWGYQGLEPAESEAMVVRLSLASSYVPIQTADSDGGYKDWFIQETNRPGFTIEVGVGTNPLPFHSFSEIWANNVLLCLEGLVL